MNNKGYSIKEMIILCSVLAIVFVVGISRVSYAYSISANEGELEALTSKNLYNAAVAYVNNNKDKFTEKETFIYGSELIENNFLFEADNTNYGKTKIKVTKNTDETYNVEVVS